MALTPTQIAQVVAGFIGEIRNPPREGVEGGEIERTFGPRKVPSDSYFISERVVKSRNAASGNTLRLFTIREQFIATHIEAEVEPEQAEDITPEILARRLLIVEPTKMLYKRAVQKQLLPELPDEPVDPIEPPV